MIYKLPCLPAQRHTSTQGRSARSSTRAELDVWIVRAGSTTQDGRRPRLTCSTSPKHSAENVLWLLILMENKAHAVSLCEALFHLLNTNIV